jgi:hypothetical protein
VDLIDWFFCHATLIRMKMTLANSEIKLSGKSVTSLFRPLVDLYVPIPILPEETQQKIHSLIANASQLRVEANKLLKEAMEIFENYDVDGFTKIFKKKVSTLGFSWASYNNNVECDKIENSISEFLKIGDVANRVKIASIQDINMPQMIVSGVDEKIIVNKGSLLSGLGEKEYMYHAIENRSSIGRSVRVIC